MLKITSLKLDYTGENNVFIQQVSSSPGGCKNHISSTPKFMFCCLQYIAGLPISVLCKHYLHIQLESFEYYSYFAKITTRKPKIGKLTNVTELYPFLQSKKWYMLLKGILWSCDLLVKTINQSPKGSKTSFSFQRITRYVWYCKEKLVLISYWGECCFNLEFSQCIVNMSPWLGRMGNHSSCF